MNGHGALAQLGERLHGMQEVSGSIPLGSTILRLKEYLFGKLVSEVSLTGFFRVSEFCYPCSTLFQTG